MWRLDTAWFFKNLLFHWHSKTKLVVWWDDIWPVVNPDTPIDPCEWVPTWYECIWWEWLPRIRWKKGIDPMPIDPEDPEEVTECKSFTSRWNWIKSTPSWVFSWADVNSWWQWTFRCYNSVTFYWRLNASNPLHQQTYLVNDIRWWVWNYVRSFVVPEWSIDEQSIFKFEVSANWEYTISIKRKTSWDLYYDWKIYQHWILEEADWETLYVWVSALAEIWSITAESTDEIYVMEHTSLILNIHNVTKKEITISDDRWQSVTLMDRNIWATAYYLEEWKTSSDWKWYLYQWWNNYPFTRDEPEREAQQVDGSIYWPNNPYSNSKLFVGNNDTWWQWWIWKTTWYPNMWWWESSSNLDKRWPCPEWYHIPTTEELMKVRNMLFRAHRYILYGSDIADMLRMPYTWRRNNWTSSIDREYAGYYWACNVPEQTGNVKANYFSFNVTLSQADWGINWSYPWASFAIRPFKN